MKTEHSDISTSAISTQNVKDIQILFTAVALIAFILFSFNFQVLAGDKNNTTTPAGALPAQTADISDFSKLDTNHDGKLTNEEVVGDETLKRGFAVIDTDVNGTIDKNEYSVFILTTSPN
jgi:hypothetical protein